MKKVFGPLTGFKILKGPEGAPSHLDLKIDTSGIEQITVKFPRIIKTLHSFDKVDAEAVNGRLILTLSGQRYVLQAKAPEKLIKKIDELRNKRGTISNKQVDFPKGTGMTCVVCGRNQANATCKQCGSKVCPLHSNYVNGVTYCQRCLVLCPKCKSAQISAHKGGFKAGSAVLGWALGGVVLGALLGTTSMNNIKLFCHNCGHKWTPTT